MSICNPLLRRKSSDGFNCHLIQSSGAESWRDRPTNRLVALIVMVTWLKDNKNEDSW